MTNLNGALTMGAVALFLLLIPGGFVTKTLVDKKIDDCWEHGESFCEYRMKPFNSPARKKYLESLAGDIDPELECDVWMEYDPEYAKTLTSCKRKQVNG
jgi:hypothetical protein